jgi:hypothetical protein
VSAKIDPNHGSGDIARQSWSMSMHALAEDSQCVVLLIAAVVDAREWRSTENVDVLERSEISVA